MAGSDDVLSLASLGMPADQSGLLGSFGGPGNLGLSLLANSGPSPVRMPFGAIMGRAGLEAQQNYLRNTLARTQVASEQQKMLMERIQLQMLMRRMGLMGDAFGMGPGSGASPNAPAGAPPQAAAPQTPPGASAPGSAPPQGAALPPASAGAGGPSLPQGAPAAPGAAPQQGPYTPMTEDQIQQVAPPGVRNVAAARAYELSDISKDPIKASEDFLAAQRAEAARRAAPVLTQLENIMKADHPAQAIRGAGNEQLLSIYPQLAQAAGVNGLTDRNVQLALTGLRNRLVAPFAQAAQAPPTHFTQQIYGNQGVANVDQNTGKVEAGHGEVETGQFVDGQGNIKLMSKAEGMRQGLQPFDASVYVNPDVSKQMGHLYATYSIPPPSGRRLTLQDMANLQAARQENPSFDATKFEAKSTAMKELGSGKGDGAQITSMGTAVQHLTQLKGYITALNNGDINGINEYKNKIAAWFGSAPPAKVELVQNIAAEEINKVAVGGPGAEPDRELVREHLDMLKASPQTAAGVADAAIGIMGARLNSIRTRVTSKLVNINKDDFNTLLVPEAREALDAHTQQQGASALPADIQAILKKHNVQY